MESAAAESNIFIMQLFHELKQKFPAVPDRVVSECIRQNFHDKGTCEVILRHENQSYLMHSYPVALKMSTAASEPNSPLANKLHCSPSCDKCARGHDKSDRVSTTRGFTFPPDPALVNIFPDYLPPSNVHPGSQVLQASGDSNTNLQVLKSSVRKNSLTCSSSESCVRKFGTNVNDLNVSDNAISASQLRPNQQFVPHSNLHYLPNVDNLQCNQPSECSGKGDNSRQFHQVGNISSQFFSQADASLDPHLYPRVNPYLPQNNLGGNSNPVQYELVSPSVGNNNSMSFYNKESYITPRMLSRQECGAASRACRGVLSSSTSYQNQSNRPCSLPISEPSMPSHSHPSSVPVIQSPFHPFLQFPSRLSAGSRQNDFNPPTSTPGSYLYHGQFPSSAFCNDEHIPESALNRNEAKTGAEYNENEDIVDNYEVNVNCSMQRRSGSCSNLQGIADTDVQHRVRSTVDVQPVPHYTCRNYWADDASHSGTLATLPPHHPRSYTSVNLTLRPPTSEPQPPIDIRSAGTSLTYSTSSYDPRQGFQSQLQIRIGPGGTGSVSALRTRAHDPIMSAEPRPRSCYVPAGAQSPVDHFFRTESLPDISALSLLSSSEESTQSLRSQLVAVGGDQLQLQSQALLMEQLERKNKLERELKKEKEKLRAMQREVHGMEKDLRRRQQLKQKNSNITLPVDTTVQKEHRLRQEIQLLQDECNKMTTEVFRSSDDRVPLGETDEEFYKNIYTGQRCRILPMRTPNSSRQLRRTETVRELEPGDGPNWTCTECTFLNHPQLDKCEQCEMPRIVLGTNSALLLHQRQDACYCHPPHTPHAHVETPQPVINSPALCVGRKTDETLNLLPDKPEL